MCRLKVHELDDILWVNLFFLSKQGCTMLWFLCMGMPQALDMTTAPAVGHSFQCMSPLYMKPIMKE